MKIGILTHPLRTNYGGVLQNYALQTVLRRMGHEVLTIDRHNDKSSLYLFASFVKRNIQHYLLGNKQIPTNYYITLTRRQFLQISQNIQHFIAEHIATTDYISSGSKLGQATRYGFEGYVVGSDQVWLKPYIPTTFFDFLGDLPVKRVAYAASGRLDWMEEGYKIEQVRELAKKFDGISVREESSIELCCTYLGVEPTLVLDPTMLLSKEDYLSLIKPHHTAPREKVLFSDILDSTPEKKELVNQIGGKLGLSKIEVRINTGQTNTIAPPIEEWIACFRDANFVVTDSFHGMALSIIFNKQFIVIGNKKRGIERFHSLLSMVGIKNRLVESEANVDITKLIQDIIDYGAVNERLFFAKKTSLNFLSEPFNRR